MTSTVACASCRLRRSERPSTKNCWRSSNNPRGPGEMLGLCVARVVGGGLVAIGTSPAAFADDCARATLVVTTRTAPPGCGARVIDRQAWRAGGALALRRED